MWDSDDNGQSIGLVSDSIKHDKYAVITCLEIIVNEIISIMPDVNQFFFSIMHQVNSKIDTLLII
jgi:hypothetical protein